MVLIRKRYAFNNKAIRQLMPLSRWLSFVCLSQRTYWFLYSPPNLPTHSSILHDRNNGEQRRNGIQIEVYTRHAYTRLNRFLNLPTSSLGLVEEVCSGIVSMVAFDAFVVINKSRSWVEASFDLNALSSTLNRVMEDLKYWTIINIL